MPPSEDADEAEDADFVVEGEGVATIAEELILAKGLIIVKGAITIIVTILADEGLEDLDQTDALLFLSQCREIQGTAPNPLPVQDPIHGTLILRRARHQIYDVLRAAAPLNQETDVHHHLATGGNWPQEAINRLHLLVLFRIVMPIWPVPRHLWPKNQPHRKRRQNAKYNGPKPLLPPRGHLQA